MKIIKNMVAAVSVLIAATSCTTEQAREISNVEYSVRKAASIYGVIERVSR